MRHLLDDQTRKRKLINLIREFGYGKTHEDFRLMLFSNGCAGALALLRLVGIIDLDHRAQWVFEQMERELYTNKGKK
jgi:hypothetical protein